MSEVREVHRSNLLLDVINPRFETEQENQREALRNMAEEQGEKLLKLADDIVQHGLDPSTLPIVILAPNEDRRFVVLEGNRRIAALKLLHEPKLAEGVWKQQRIEKLSALKKSWQTPIDEVTCVILPGRDEANHWIRLRHRGEQQGRGIVGWDGLAAARYEERRGGGYAQAALHAVDFVRQRAHLEQAILDRLEDIPITTVQRLLDDPDVRERLGVQLEKGLLTTRLSDEELLKGLIRIVRDAALGTLKVSRIETKEDRQKYLAEFSRNELPSSSAKLGDPRPVMVTAGAPPTEKAKAVSPTKKRAVLIPRTCVLTIPENKPNDIYHELRRLKLEDFPNAIGVLFRVLLELSIDYYISSSKLMTATELDTAKLSAKLGKVADHMVQSKAKTKREVSVLRHMANPQHFLACSLDTLHSYVHDADFRAAPSDLRAAWDSLEHVFKTIWK